MNELTAKAKKHIICPICNTKATISHFAVEEGIFAAWSCSDCKLILKVIDDE